MSFNTHLTPTKSFSRALQQAFHDEVHLIRIVECTALQPGVVIVEWSKTFFSQEQQVSWTSSVRS